MLLKNKKIILLIFITFSIFASYKLVYIIGEKYYFDKLFYRKSTSHGYFNININDGSFFNANNKLLKQSRFKDISSLINQKETKVLGANTENEKIYKIAIIGDSVTYGLGVQDSEKYTSILEKELNKLYLNKKFEVYNFSLVGDDLLDNYIKYLMASKISEYDLYIFAYITNDILIEDNSKYPQKKEIYEAFYKECNNLSEGKLVEEQFKNSEDKYNKFLALKSEESANVCMTNLILNNVSKNNVLFFATEGTGDINLYEKDQKLQTSDDFYTLALTNYSKYIKLNNFKIINPYDKDSLFPTKNSNISKKEIHPNKTIHKLFAYFLTQEIIKNQRNISKELKDNEQLILCEYEKKIAEDVSRLIKEDISPIKYCEWIY